MRAFTELRRHFATWNLIVQPVTAAQLELKAMTRAEKSMHVQYEMVRLLRQIELGTEALMNLGTLQLRTAAECKMPGHFVVTM